MSQNYSLPDPIAVVDVETTGLSPWRHDRIVEIAIVMMSPDGRIHSEYESLVNPERDVGPTRIHRISAAEVLHAPTFREIAGDILDLLRRANLVAGHNIGFDRNFLVKEYERIGITLPDFSCLCTCRMLGRKNLEVCCTEFGISFDGDPHWAIHDARTTAHLVHTLIQEDPSSFEEFRESKIDWPLLPCLGTTPVTRRTVQEKSSRPPNFLHRVVAKVHHDVEATQSDILAYLTLLDRVLEDRVIDATEANILVDAALQWNLDANQVSSAHRHYIHKLAVHALADGIITDIERNDLYQVARLLGYDRTELDATLDAARRQLQTVAITTPTPPTSDNLRGKTVCFTGELQAAINGQPITREIAEALAEKAGLLVANSVTKKTDLLVVADPDTQSSKARKARQYGIRILAEPVFWRMIGVNVE
jgi:DNA polymerase-3 subunit epsilon